MITDRPTVRAALESGAAVVLPNPIPLTCVVAATDPAAVNLAKSRPADQPVATWAASPQRWADLVPDLALSARLVEAAHHLLTRELVTLLVPVRPRPALAPSTRDGYALLFGAHTMAELFEGLGPVYVSSANRTGHTPAPTPEAAARMFPPTVPILGAVDTSGDRRATTTLKLTPEGELTLTRTGAQDHANGGPAAYLRLLADRW